MAILDLIVAVKVSMPEKVWPIVFGSFLMAAFCGICLWPLFGEINASERLALWDGVISVFGGGALIALEGSGLYRPITTLSPHDSPLRGSHPI